MEREEGKGRGLILMFKVVRVSGWKGRREGVEVQC